MANAPVFKHVFLTGSPGVGKTTMVRRICETLRGRSVPVQGFYTEECRHQSTRIGFDVVTLTGERKPLARAESSNSQGTSTHRVGKYCVLTSSFEELAVRSLTLPEGQVPLPVIVVDEIGKMELFSGRFEQTIRQLLSRDNVTILATIPSPRRSPIPFVEEIRRDPAVQVFEITKENRRNVHDEIVDAVLQAYKAH